MRQKIVIAVGGTGGHVLPAQKIGRKLSSKYDVVYMGVGLSKNPFFEKEGVHYYDIEGAGFAQGILECGKANFRGVRAAKIILAKLKPEFVIGFGSFHTFPVLAATVYLGILYYLFEFNVVPGKVNRLFSQGARKVFIHFEPKRKKLRGNLTPIDYHFEEISKVSQNEARLHFGLNPHKKTLLVFGGSQGAEAINDLIIKGAEQLKGEFQVLHFPGKETDFHEIYTRLSIPSFVEPFCNRMDLAWRAADLTICRSGAGAMREILIYETPAILIPYPNAKDDHQTDNAKYIEEIVKGGVYLKQSSITSELLMRQIFVSGVQVDLMKQSIQKFKQQEKRLCFSEVL